MSHKKANQRLSNIKQRSLLIPNKDFFINDFYGDDDKDRECYYCKIKESEIYTLINKCHINTKRLDTRGRSMEVDRTEPHLGYVENNIKLVCYWCNNAKTDEFNENEFKKIGDSLKEIWKERLTMKRNNEKNTERLLTDWDTTVNNIFFAFPYGMESPTSEHNWWKDLEKLISKIKKYKPTININIIYKDAKKIVKEVKKVEKDTYNFIANPYLEDVWLRDFMPLALSNYKAVKAVYSPTYYDEKNKSGKIIKKYRKYSHNSHRAGLYIAKEANIECLSLSEGSGYWHEEISTDGEILPIILDGGNFIHNGKIGFISARLLVENYAIDFDECSSKAIMESKEKEIIVKIINIIKKQTNLETIHILPTEEIDEKPEMTGHLDGTMRFLNEKKLLICQDYYNTHESFLKKIFNKNDITHMLIQQTIMENDKSNKDNEEENIKGILLNYLRIQDTLFIPCWDKVSTDKKLEKHEKELDDFIKICEEGDSNINCVKVKESGSISSRGGLFNCISWTSKI